MSRLSQKDLASIKEMRRLLEMETCLFHCPEHLAKVYRERGQEPDTAFTADVKEQTRLWRETWVISELDQISEQPHVRIKNWKITFNVPHPNLPDGSPDDNATVGYALSVDLSDGRHFNIPISPRTAEQIDEREYVGGIIAPLVNQAAGTSISSADW